MRVGIEAKEGLQNLERFDGFAPAIQAHLPLGVATHAMGIDSQKLSAEVSSCPSQQPQFNLQRFGFGHGVGCQQIMDGLVAGDKRQTVESFKALLAQGACFPHTRDAQGRFVNQLQRQARFHPFGRLTRPTRYQIPRAQPQMFRRQQPQSHHVAG